MNNLQQTPKNKNNNTKNIVENFSLNKKICLIVWEIVVGALFFPILKLTNIEFEKQFHRA